MNKFSSPVLASSNNAAVYVHNGQLMLLDETFTEAKVLLNEVEGASHLKWSPNGLHVAFILNGQLKIVAVETAHVMEAPLQSVSQFEWETDTTLYMTNEEKLYYWSLQGEGKLILEQASIEAYSRVTQMAIIQRNKKLFAVQLADDEVGELLEVTAHAGRYRQAAFSFSGQYVAYIGETLNGTERHVFVYDFDLKATQNLTAMLDVYAGDAMSPHTSDEQGVKEIQWIETDALYFLLSSDGDVRLYYADLYGSLFPASPENEHIESYAVANNGNWAIYVADRALQGARLDWFDITMGEGRTIVSEPPSLKVPVETYYEIMQIAEVTYYIWGYVPSQCEEAVVVLSGKGRMLGNGFEQRIVAAVNEQKAFVYVNHPGALGYGVSYANETFVDEVQVKNVVEKWLTQILTRSMVVGFL